MDLEPLLSAVARVRADGAGVRDYSIQVTHARQLSLGVKDRQAGNAHTPLSLTESAGARYLFVWDDGRVSRGALERRQVEQEPEEAVRGARAAAYDDPDAARVSGPAPMPEVETHEAAAASVAGGDVTFVGRRLAAIRARLAAHEVRTWSGSFSAREATTRLVTSAGLDVAGRGTLLGWHVTLDGEVGDGFSARAADPAPEFDARLARLVANAEALRRPAPSMSGGIHPILLHPRVVENYVIHTLLTNLDGSTVAHGDGHFGIDRFGSDRAVLREDIGLAVDPLRPLRRGSYRFTSEGVPAAPCTFIEAGRLVQPVLDLKYAHRLDRSPTSVPYAPDTIRFGADSATGLEQGMAGAEGGALVLSVLGVHTQDSTSGDFSLSAPQALRLRGNGPDGRLRATLSGNLFEVLRDPELRFVRFEGESTPGMLFRCRLDPK